MAVVNTITGPVDAARLGVTLVYEHATVTDPEGQQSVPDAGWDEERWARDAAAELAEAKRGGVDTIVGFPPTGPERGLAWARRAAEAGGVQVVVATGMRSYRDLPFAVSGTPAELVDLFVRDIERGIAGTGVKAGMLTCTTGELGVVPGVERVLRAVAWAHRRTGVPVFTRSSPHAHDGLAQQRILAAEGVDLSRVVIGHCGGVTDLGYLEELVGAGSYLSMERFSPHAPPPVQGHARIVAALCERGHAGRLLLTHGGGHLGGCLPGQARALLATGWRSASGWALPALRARGVTAEQLTAMLVDNPRRVFERQGAY